MKGQDLFKSDAPLDCCFGFLQHLRTRHWGEEILRLAAFEQQSFPDLSHVEDGLGTRGIEGQGQRLDKDDHCEI